MSWKDNDELFFKELHDGYEWQKIVALHFNKNELNVVLPPLSIRDSFDKASDYIDSKDLIVEGHVIEVKSRREKFTSPKDFPYSTIFVDTVAGYDSKITKPLAYVMISRETKSMLCLPSFVKPDYWTKETKYDNVRQIHEVFYMAPKNKLQPIQNLIAQIKTKQYTNLISNQE